MGKQGFASMDKDRLREVCRKGAARLHELGVAHTFTKEEARAAGLKGLQVRYKKNVHSKEQMDNSEETSI